MLLRQLTLKNIRSYKEETITFPEGSILLAGDIGSGKSSILLAIEFALFGTSRPDLPAEMLLRKGATSGAVELTFQLGDQEIIIQRNLKKEKDAIKQMPGNIIINKLKKEVMPIELKAEILNLLGYPEEFITKNKNYIFRFTVYTPQEEMKAILLEDAETRLDVLRKVFNIDKYKCIRENMQLYLKEMRTQLAILNTRIEPLEEQTMHFERIKQDLEILQKSLADIQPQLSSLQKMLGEEKKALESLENEQLHFIKLQQDLRSVNTLLIEKRTAAGRLEQKVQEMEREISQEIALTMTKKEITSIVQQIEKQLHEIAQKKTILQERVKIVQLRIKERQTELEQLHSAMATLPEKKRQQQEWMQEITQKKEMLDRKEQLEMLLEQTSFSFNKNELILHQSRETCRKIASLDMCPLCLQNVDQNHKETVFSQEKQKMTQAESSLHELNKKKNEITFQKKDVTEKIERLITLEKNLAKCTAELAQLHEKKEQWEQKKEQLTLLVQENNQLMQDVASFQQQQETTQLQEDLKKNQEWLQKLTKREYVEQHLQEISGQQKNLLQEIAKLQDEISALEILLKEKQDVTERIKTQRRKITELLDQEKNVAVEHAQVITMIENATQQKIQIEKIIHSLWEQKKMLVQQRELYHWLEEHFLKITYTIERQVMLHIYHLFNQLFQEWFALLIEDETLNARIDESFSPVIEQNGYEVGFLNLSGGEKTSASLAYRLALNRVINDVIHRIKTKNLLILDEPTDGFSSEQLDKVRDVLERLNLQQTIIVSHESKIESFMNNIIRIVKEGHVSRVLQ